MASRRSACIRSDRSPFRGNVTAEDRESPQCRYGRRTSAVFTSLPALNLVSHVCGYPCVPPPFSFSLLFFFTPRVYTRSASSYIRNPAVRSRSFARKIARRRRVVGKKRREGESKSLRRETVREPPPSAAVELFI